MTEAGPSEPQVDLEHVGSIVATRMHERGGVIAVLEAIQNHYGYLPEAALRAVATQTGRSLVDIYGIATFYRFFSLKPRGKHLVCACLGTACHVRGGPRIVEELERQLGLSAGQTTDDGEFTLETVNCLGACALGPVVVIDGRCHSKLRRSQIRPLLDQVRQGLAGRDGEEALAFGALEVGCPHCNHSLMDEAVLVGGLASIRLVASAGTEQGWVRRSSVPDSGAFEADPPMAPGRVVRLFCPHCGQGFEEEGMCPQCESLMASLACRRGGMVRVCLRLGCPGMEYELT